LVSLLVRGRALWLVLSPPELLRVLLRALWLRALWLRALWLLASWELLSGRL
jgi:hypothetical protein